MSSRTTAPGAFILWLRQVRRSTWILLALCMVLRVGGAVIHDDPATLHNPPVLSGG